MSSPVMVRSFVTEETDPLWSVRTGMPMQISMGDEIQRLYLVEAKVERSGFTVFKGTLNGKPVEGFFGLKEKGWARRLLSGSGMIKILSVLIMISPISLFM